MFTSLSRSAAELAEQHINAGNVFVNSFGGVKKSGYGHELSEFVIHEFVNIKTIKIDI